jgi:glucose/arabinose dehydrogenase
MWRKLGLFYQRTTRETSTLLLLLLWCPVNVPQSISFIITHYCQTDLPNPRALVLAPNGDILVVLADVSRIAAMWEDPITGAIQSVTLVGRSGLNHALRLHNGWLYASSATTIFRWPYSAPEQMRVPFGSPEVVLTDMPPTGIFGHLSRTMVFDAAGRMYVNVGSDGDSSTVPNRAAVWRYNVYGSTLPLQWPRDGEVFANGTRNSVGLCFDRWGRLWSPENGSKT